MLLFQVNKEKQLIKKLDTYFKKFDQIIGKYNLEKIKTIGDAYMVVGGLKQEVTTTDYVAMALASIEMKEFVLNEALTASAFGEDPWEMRMGIHTGPLVAGVIGSRKFSYDVWGDTVNTASRLESSGEPGYVNISQTTYQLVKDKFNCSPRGKVKTKGKDEIEMYFVN